MIDLLVGLLAGARASWLGQLSVTHTVAHARIQ